MRLRTLLPLAALVVTACATPSTEGVTNAATSPLRDLNLVHTDIPPVLLEAVKAPYTMPPIANCPALGLAVRALDGVLGPDVDAPKEHERGLMEEGGNMASDAAIGAIKSAADGLLPYRQWVRKLSGAEWAGAQVRNAIAAGNARRAFLKGLMAASGCPWSATPIQPDP